MALVSTEQAGGKGAEVTPQLDTRFQTLRLLVNLIAGFWKYTKEAVTDENVNLRGISI
jgi:hypothetical protein